jgi:hypothetical protein
MKHVSRAAPEESRGPERLFSAGYGDPVPANKFLGIPVPHAPCIRGVRGMNSDTR